MNRKKSAFAVFLENRERMTLPQRPSNNNKRDALTIMITDWLEEIELGFSPDAVNAIGKIVCQNTCSRIELVCLMFLNR